MQGELRYIFPATVLLVWVLFGTGIATGHWSGTQWLVLGLAHLFCAVIFVNFVYVFNYGYGLTKLFLSLALLVLMPSPATAIVGGMAAVFGLRLLQFTHARYRSAAYAAQRERQQRASAAMPLPVKVFLWTAVSWLMAFQAMPTYFVARSGEFTGFVWVGAAVMLAGLGIEALADIQKQQAKRRAPDAFVDAGLFRWARHPNYLGEIVFQLGFIVSVLGSLHGGYELAVGIVAPLYVCVLMLFAGRDADRQQQARYGSNPAWQQYCSRTGRFLPRPHGPHGAG
jgi:steroid 5-alpha reductase family enzyme